MNQKLNRRNFLSTTAAASSALLMSQDASAQDKPRPNILWLTSEDNGPHLGCYGDDDANTPIIDGLAKKGTKYLHAWSTAPVCAPARTTIISGVYPSCLGAEHMRSHLPLPANMKMYPQYLREAGYYCTNNRKEDYNLEKPGKVWDESSGDAHWRNRQPGQPFFAIFNFTTTHESQIRRRPHDWKHDPDKVDIPAYHPDTPEVRKDWAQYHDKMTEMDKQVGNILQQLKEDGLEEDTIIFYYGDHGAGMPRGKRWTYNSGLHVPMIVHIPEKFQHLMPEDYKAGGESDRLVGFIDLAPTALSLVGVKPPAHMQGHAFLGEFAEPKPEFAFGFRGRMDERYDMVRCCRDERYIYIRNYMPHKIYGQYVSYMFQTPTTQVWHQLYEQGKLEPPKTYFWEKKPAEELYDLYNDPDEVNNLIDSPNHQEIKERLRRAQQHWVKEIRDVGFLPEDEIHSRSEGSTAYEMGHNTHKYPMAKIFETAEIAAGLEMTDLHKLMVAFDDSDSAVRYWAAMGVLMRESKGVETARPQLREALKDESHNVQVVAAQALGQYGNEEDLDLVLPVLLERASLDHSSVYVSILALNAIDHLGVEKTMPLKDKLAKLPKNRDDIHGRVDGYVPRLLDKILSDMAD